MGNNCFFKATIREALYLIYKIEESRDNESLSLDVGFYFKPGRRETNMLIFMTFVVALLFGALGGFLYHLQQPLSEREGLSQISWPGRHTSPSGETPFHLGVLGDCLYGAVGGLLMVALLTRLLGEYVTPIFQASTISVSGELFIAWLYLIATSVLGGYLGLRLLRVASASSLMRWKRQLGQLQQQVQSLEGELRESRSSLLLQEATHKLLQGYLSEAKAFLEQALLLTPSRARVLAYLGYCKALLAQEQNRVEGQDPVTFEQALQDLNEGIRLVEERIDRRSEASVSAGMYYNRACVQYLKWSSQGRSPAKLTDEEVRRLALDIERALRLDHSNRIWNQLLSDCGLRHEEKSLPVHFVVTHDFKSLYEQSPAFKAFVQELKEARAPSFDVEAPFPRMAQGLELESVGY